MVDLATLESLIMIDGDEVMTPAVKGRFWTIVRRERNRRREEAGQLPVGTIH